MAILMARIANSVVERGSGDTEKDGEFLPPFEEIVEGLAQVRIGLDALVVDRGGHPLLQLVQDGSAESLVGSQSLVVGEALGFAVAVDLVDLREPLEKRDALGGEVGDLVDPLASAMGDTIGLDHVMAHGHVARKRVAHEQRDGPTGVAWGEQLGEVFARVLSSRKEEGDRAERGDDGDDGGGE